jgi:hypothetical protein
MECIAIQNFESPYGKYSGKYGWEIGLEIKMSEVIDETMIQNNLLN